MEVDIEWLVDAFNKLARGDETGFGHLLTAHADPMLLEDTRTTVRTHFVAIDVNGEPATTQLVDVMASALLDFCIPRSRINQALSEAATTGSTSAISALHDEARKLLVTSDTSGEGGELLLFLLMEKSLGYPQILSKMPLKTNTEMHVHGSDGVHAKLGSDGILDLYWGESKLYEDSSKAFTDCFESIAPFLKPDGHEVRKRDLLLVREHLNVIDDKLAAYLIKFFDSSNSESLRVRWNGVCLVGFDVSKYPNPAAAMEAELARIEAQVMRWQKAILKRITDNNLESVTIDVFCVPFPSVMAIRKALRAKVGNA